jgi:hypothetical protein
MPAPRSAGACDPDGAAPRWALTGRKVERDDQNVDAVACQGRGRGPLGAVARLAGCAGDGRAVLALRADTHAAPGRPLQPASRLEQPVVAGRPAPGVAPAGAGTAACLPAQALQGQPALAGPRHAVGRGLHRTPWPLAWPVRGRHAVLLHRRVHQGLAQGPAGGAVQQLRLAVAAAEEAVGAGAEEHRRAGRPAAAQPGRTRAAAVRHAGTLPARPARSAGRVQGVQRTGGLCRAGRGGRRRRARRGRGPACRFAARTHRHDREPDLRAEHHRPGRPDEGQRTAAAGADARIRRPGRPDGRVHAAGAQERPATRRLRLRRRRRAGADRPVATGHRAPRGRCQRAAVRAARHRQDRAGEGLHAGRGARTVRGGIRRPRRQQPVGPRPLPQPADQPGLPEGQPRRGAAVRRGRGRVPADQHRSRAADCPPGQRRRAGVGQRQRQGLGQPDPGNQPGAGGLDHQPHRADRPGLSPTLPVPPAAEVPATGRARGAGCTGPAGRARG